MTDQRVREAERRWRRTRTVQDQAQLLCARLRCGDLTPSRLQLAAYLEHPASLAALEPLGIAPATPDVDTLQAWYRETRKTRRSLQPLERWVFGLAHWGTTPLEHAALALGASYLPEIPDDVLRACAARLLDALCAYGVEPGFGTAQRVREQRRALGAVVPREPVGRVAGLAALVGVEDPREVGSLVLDALFGLNVTLRRTIRRGVLRWALASEASVARKDTTYPLRQVRAHLQPHAWPRQLEVLASLGHPAAQRSTPSSSYVSALNVPAWARWLTAHARPLVAQVAWAHAHVVAPTWAQLRPGKPCVARALLDLRQAGAVPPSRIVELRAATRRVERRPGPMWEACAAAGRAALAAAQAVEDPQGAPAALAQLVEEARRVKSFEHPGCRGRELAERVRDAARDAFLTTLL